MREARPNLRTPRIVTVPEQAKQRTRASWHVVRYAVTATCEGKHVQRHGGAVKRTSKRMAACDNTREIETSRHIAPLLRLPSIDKHTKSRELVWPTNSLLCIISRTNLKSATCHSQTQHAQSVDRAHALVGSTDCFGRQFGRQARP